MSLRSHHAKQAILLQLMIVTTLLVQVSPMSIEAIAYQPMTGMRASEVGHFQTASLPPRASAEAHSKAAEAYGRVPLSFEANVGQTDDARVKFLSRGRGYNVYLTSTEAAITFAAPKSDREAAKRRRRGFLRGPGYSRSGVNDQERALRICLSGANKAAKVKGLNELPGKNNYFVGSDPRKWRLNVKTYSRVEYESIYQGVDLVYYGTGQQLEYDFKVAARANPAAIGLRFEGTGPLEINSAGDLMIGSQGGEIRQLKAVAYQENNGAKQEVQCNYVLRDNREVAFQLGEYDAGKPLTIDPILSYSTYFGSSLGQDYIAGLALDPAGNAYIAGSTGSENFPVTPGSFQDKRKGFESAFVTKLNASGTAILYSTYLGGSNYETGSGIAVDPAGNAYVTGSSGSVDFPTTANAFKKRLRGSTDVFVTKLNPAGNGLAYSTYLGGRGDAEFSAGIALDSAGNAYVTGATMSVDFPVTSGAAQEQHHGNSDVFVTKLNAEGSGLVYSTFLGGSLSDGAANIAVDSVGNAYVAGITMSSDFPTRKAYQPALIGTRNVFVTKLNQAGTSLVYSTYLGGGSEEVTGLAVDLAGSAYVVGYTSSNIFPTTPGALQRALSGPSDVFLTKLSVRGSELAYSTYLGGSDFDRSGSVALDAAGNIYVTGGTSSFDFPLASPLQDKKRGSSLLKSTDAGVSWADVRVLFRSINQIVPDPQNHATFYATTSDSIIKSNNKGNSWVETGRRFASRIFFDPVKPSTIYGLTDLRFFKSTDGGASSSVVDISPGNFLDGASGIVVDPTNPATLYVSTGMLPVPVPGAPKLLAVPARSQVFKSTDGGSTWFPLDLGLTIPTGGALAIDPQNPSTVYAAVGPAIYKTTNAGSTWTARTTDFLAVQITIDPINTSIAYATSFNSFHKTTDAGNTWRRLPEPKGFVSNLTISPKTPTTLYASTNVLLKSTDQGEHWQTILNLGGNLTVDPDNESTLYLGRFSQDDAFVTKLSASGSAVYSTYLGGYAFESGCCIAVDPFGNAYVAGLTSSLDLPVTLGAFQTQLPGFSGHFIIRIIDPKRPRVLAVSIKGKKLIVTGESFDKGAVILIANLEQDTQNDESLPSTVLISNKAGKKITPGQAVVIQVRNSEGSLSEPFSFTRPTQ